jgi:class 3 adenylate cyclase
MRIGINTGEVVVGAIGDNLRMDYTAQGDTTNLAARLQTMAAPGGILISEQTYRPVAGDFDFENLGETQVKGRSKPVHVYQPKAARARRGSVDIAEGPYLTRFQGRDRELQRLFWVS